MQQLIKKFNELLIYKNLLTCETPSGLKINCFQNSEGVLLFYIQNDCIVQHDDIEYDQLNKLYELFKKQNIDE